MRLQSLMLPYIKNLEWPKPMDSDPCHFPLWTFINGHNKYTTWPMVPYIFCFFAFPHSSIWYGHLIKLFIIGTLRCVWREEGGFLIDMKASQSELITALLWERGKLPYGWLIQNWPISPVQTQLLLAYLFIVIQFSCIYCATCIAFTKDNLLGGRQLSLPLITFGGDLRMLFFKFKKNTCVNC